MAVDGRLRGIRVALACALLLTAGCGVARPPGTEPARPPGTDAARAAELLVDSGDLPGQFRPARGRDGIGSPRFCGVSLVPPGVRERAIERYAAGPLGPFLVQYVFVAGEGGARAPVRELVRELHSCSRYTATAGDGRDVTFAIERLRGLRAYGDASVGFRVEPTGRAGLPAEYLAIRHGRALVFFAAFSGAEPPPRALLRAGAEALPAR